MTIEDYADILNLELVIRRYPNQKNRYSAQFDNTEFKDDRSSACLSSLYGDGDTSVSAVQKFVENIRGKVLVFKAMTDKERREYVVPMSLDTY